VAGDDASRGTTVFPSTAVEGVDGPLPPVFPAPLPDGRWIDLAAVETYVMPYSVDTPLPTGRQRIASITLLTDRCGV